MASLARQVAGFISLYCSCSISSAGGIGGGGLNVPIFLVIFRYSYNEAVILSLCTVLGNYVSQVALNWNKRHPADQRRPLIYWDAVLILLPAQLGGGSIGVIIAKTFPEGLLILVSMVVLAFAGFKSFKKGCKFWRQETLLQLGQSGLHRPLAAQEVPNLAVAVQQPDSEAMQGEGEAEGEEDETDKADKADDDDANQESGGAPTLNLPWVTLRALAIIWIVYACLYTILAIALKLCSAGYWALLATSYVLLLAAVLWGLGHVAAKQQSHEMCVLEGDIVLTKSCSPGPPVAAFLIGVMCTTLGIGGGELMGPLLLSLKVLPQVVSATTSTMSFINTSSNLVHYALLGEIGIASFFTFFAIGSVGGISGRFFYLHVSQHYGRPSITVFMLISVLVLSFWLLVYHLATEPEQYSSLSSQYCPK